MLLNDALLCKDSLTAPTKAQALMGRTLPPRENQAILDLPEAKQKTRHDSGPSISASNYKRTGPSEDALPLIPGMEETQYVDQRDIVSGFSPPGKPGAAFPLANVEIDPYSKQARRAHMVASFKLERFDDQMLSTAREDAVELVSGVLKRRSLKQVSYLRTCLTARSGSIGPPSCCRTDVTSVAVEVGARRERQERRHLTHLRCVARQRTVYRHSQLGSGKWRHGRRPQNRHRRLYLRFVND
ncbi:hypothetical protein ACJZ2D_004471 [Fusarium nematophilum]